MALRLVTPPTVEPVSVQEAKLHLRLITDITDISNTAEDNLIGVLISAAREYAENVCRRAFVTQSYLLTLDAFPLYSYSGTYSGYVPVEQQRGFGIARNYSVRFNGGKITLPFPRLVSVDSVQFIDASGALQTLSPTAYVVDAETEPGALVPAPAMYWPTVQNTVNAVRISYTAGYGAAAAVPAGIKAWMLLRIGALYENREDVLVGRSITVAELPFTDMLLDRYRVMDYV
jgi:uncharacterized phiE125 gp8 family phage protein